MDFGEVLGQAWKITWKHKILWIFGIFAGCSRGGGGGGGGGGSGGGFNPPNNQPGGQGPSPEVPQFLTQFVDWVSQNPWIWVVVVLGVLVLIALTIWLGTMGRIGLIQGTFKADGGAERLGFGELWRESTPFFWRVFGLSLLLGLAVLIILLPLTLLGVVTAGVGFICILPLICLLIPAIIAAGLVLQQAEVAIVVENLGMMEGLRRGWNVFKQNLGPVLIIWLILAVIGFMAGLVISIPILIVVVPAVLIFAGKSGGPTLDWTPLIVAGLCVAAYFPVLLVLNGVLTTYLQSAWALTFMRLTKPKPTLETPLVAVPNA